MKQTKNIIKYAPFVFNHPTDAVCEEVITLEDLKELIENCKKFIPPDCPVKKLIKKKVNS